MENNHLEVFCRVLEDHKIAEKTSVLIGGGGGGGGGGT